MSSENTAGWVTVPLGNRISEWFRSKYERNVASSRLTDRVELFGLDIHDSTISEAAEWIVAQARNQITTTVGFINAHCINMLHRSTDYSNALTQFDRLFADGSGMRMAAKASGFKLQDNVNGTDLFPVLCQEAAAENISLYLLGGRDRVASVCGKRMMRSVSELDIAGTHPGFFEDDAHEERIIAEINESGAGILLVGLGVPLQEEWVARNRDRITVPAVLAVGGLFDYYSGRIKRAPLAIRQSGFEWAWRLILEPRRLAKRYILGNAEFLARLSARKCWEVASAFGPDLLSPGMKRRVAVYGATKESQATFNKIVFGGRAIRFVGLFDDRNVPSRQELFGVPVSGLSSDLIELARNGGVDDIVIALPKHAKERTATIARKFKNLPVEVFLEQDNELEIEDAEKARFKLGWHNNMTMTRVQSRPVAQWGQFFKTLFDRCVSVVALVFLSPFLALIAVAIKLDSPGPVFFRQRRHGLGGRTIVVWKFRTMTVAEDSAEVKQASKDDMRVTRVGRLLRKTSLDELPQLINVLNGSMSLIGPRPHAVAHNEYYEDLIESYGMRNLMKPGISGWAQICGLRGETPDVSSMEQRVSHDLWYIQNWSPLLDMRILFMTPVYGLIHKNAY